MKEYYLFGNKLNSKYTKELEKMDAKELKQDIEYMEGIWNEIKEMRENGIKEEIINEKFHNEIDDDILHSMIFIWNI